MFTIHIVCANEQLAERFLVAYLPWSMVNGPWLEGLRENQDSSATSRICVSGRETLHRRSTYVRNARFGESNFGAEHYFSRSNIESWPSPSFTKLPDDPRT